MERNWENDPMINALDEVMRTLDTPGSEWPAAVEPVAEAESLLPVFAVPANINELLDTALVDANMEGGTTIKYRVAGHPDLLVRHNEGYTLTQQIEGYRAAQATGLNPVPTEFVTHNGEVYAVTPLVRGIALDELLALDPEPEVIAATDKLMATIATEIVTAHRQDDAWPIDAHTPNQFIWGTIPGDVQPRLWLVDLPTDTRDIATTERFGIELLYTIGGLLYAEQAAGRQFPGARHAFSEAIVSCPDSARYGDGFRRAGAHCLVNGQNFYQLPGDEYDFVDWLRTY
jgi:hypothetical protein